MKTLVLFAFSTAVLLTGCESMSSRMQERFTPVPPHTRVFAAGRKVVYEAAQQAVKNVGLQLGRKSFAEGRIEGYAAIRSGDNNTRDARQTTIDIRLFETDALETRVELLVNEQTEGDFPGGVSKQGVREHSLYELYFTALQQVLAEKGAVKATEKP
jgi:hypothetical protein